MSARAVADNTTGGVLYAFRHVSTNQVLYSRTKTLPSSALRQLPDIGANRTPATIRRDVWRPFWSVHAGESQAASDYIHTLYERLLRLRKLHEVTWRRPAELALSYTKEQLKTIADDHNEKGGSKVESTYDLIRRRKKNLKARVIMDQKANSVADLAQVLESQYLENRRLRRGRSDIEKREQSEIMRLERFTASHTERQRSLSLLEFKIERLKTRISSRKWEDTPEILRLKEEIRALKKRHEIVQRRAKKKLQMSEDIVSEDIVSEDIVKAEAKLRKLQPVTKAQLLRRLAEFQKRKERIRFAYGSQKRRDYPRAQGNRQRHFWLSKVLRMAEKQLRQLNAPGGVDGGSTAESGPKDDSGSGTSLASFDTEKKKYVLGLEVEKLRVQVRNMYEKYRRERFPPELRSKVPEKLQGWGPEESVLKSPITILWDYEPDKYFARSWPPETAHLQNIPDESEVREIKKAIIEPWRETLAWQLSGMARKRRLEEAREASEAKTRAAVMARREAKRELRREQARAKLQKRMAKLKERKRRISAGGGIVAAV